MAFSIFWLISYFSWDFWRIEILEARTHVSLKEFSMTMFEEFQSLIYTNLIESSWRGLGWKMFINDFLIHNENKCIFKVLSLRKDSYLENETIITIHVNLLSTFFIVYCKNGCLYYCMCYVYNTSYAINVYITSESTHPYKGTADW